MEGARLGQGGPAARRRGWWVVWCGVVWCGVVWCGHRLTVPDLAEALFRFCPDLIARAIGSFQVWKPLFNLCVAQLQPIKGRVIDRRAVIMMIGAIGLRQSQRQALQFTARLVFGHV